MNIIINLVEMFMSPTQNLMSKIVAIVGIVVTGFLGVKTMIFLVKGDPKKTGVYLLYTVCAIVLSVLIFGGVSSIGKQVGDDLNQQIQSTKWFIPLVITYMYVLHKKNRKKAM